MGKTLDFKHGNTIEIKRFNQQNLQKAMV